MKNGPQGPPKKEKNQKKGIFGHWGPKWLTKKIFGDFRGGVSKSMLLLTERRQMIDEKQSYTETDLN